MLILSKFVYIVTPRIAPSYRQRSTKMANNVNPRQFLALKLEALSEAGVFVYSTPKRKHKRGAMMAPSVSEDELLASLADAQENRRARQAYEWEAVRRKAERRAAARVGTYVCSD